MDSAVENGVVSFATTHNSYYVLAEQAGETEPVRRELPVPEAHPHKLALMEKD